jgi:hypothetical protein
VAILVELISELSHVSGDLGLQRSGQHLPSPIADNLVQQRPAGLVTVGLLGIVNYGEHGRTFPTSAPTPVLIRATGLSDHPREGAPTFMHLAESHPQILIIATTA